MFTGALFTIVKIQKQTKSPWMGQEDVREIYMYTHTHIERYTHNGIKLGQKEQNLVMCDNTDEPWEYYVAEINQKKTNTTWVHLYVESKGKNKQANETETDL